MKRGREKDKERREDRKGGRRKDKQVKTERRGQDKENKEMGQDGLSEVIDPGEDRRINEILVK